MKKLIYCVLLFVLVFTISASAEESLKFAVWTYKIDIVSENLKVFEDQYGIKVDCYDIPGDQYHDKMVVSFVGGTEYDVILVRDSFLGEWASAGWLQSIDGFEGIEQCKEDLPQGALAQMTFEGKLYGLPYYGGRKILAYNEAHLKEAGIDSPPKTWDELLEQAKIIKEKGISENPIIFAMSKNREIMLCVEVLVYARGGKLFDENNDPIFNKENSTTFEALEWAKEAIKVGLLDEASISSDTYDCDNALAAGTATFSIVADFDLSKLNDPKASKTAGNMKMALVPGTDKVRSGTKSWIRFYSITENSKQKENAWKLVKFLGGRDKDGVYYVAKKWALTSGLGFVQKSLYEDKEIIESIKKWGDPEVIRTQDEYEIAAPFRLTPWFAEWETEAWGEFQKAVMGSKPIQIVLDELAEKAKELKAMY